MTDEEVAQLEYLLGKLTTEIGNRICIIPYHIHDGVQIGVYHESGSIIKETTAATLKKAIEKIKA